MIGRLMETVQAILPALLCYCQLQRLKNETFRTVHSYSTKVILEPGARQDLQWWRDHLNKWNGKQVLPQSPDMFMETRLPNGMGSTMQRLAIQRPVDQQ